MWRRKKLASLKAILVTNYDPPTRYCQLVCKPEWWWWSSSYNLDIEFLVGLPLVVIDDFHFIFKLSLSNLKCDHIVHLEMMRKEIIKSFVKEIMTSIYSLGYICYLEDNYHDDYDA